MSAGKGSSPRNCFSRQFRDNWDRVFGKAKGKKLKAKTDIQNPPALTSSRNK